MNNESITKAYMATHVLLNSKTPVDEWTDEQIVLAFAMLPSPAVTLDQFKAKLQVNETPDDISEEEKLAHNDKMLKLHKAG